MYDNHLAHARRLRPTVSFNAACAAIIVGLAIACPATAQVPVQMPVQDPNSVIRKITTASEKLELTTNTSRILTMDKKIPRVQVNNPELVAVTPLSATDIQISAKKTGVTQVNLWDEDGNIHTVDVMIYGDARELSNALQTQFPHSSIRVYRYSESLVLTGFVDRPDHVGPIMRLAEDYAPKVINNINVGGVQQILLKVKVMEINRTKLRRVGVDWAWFGGGGDFAVSRPGELISSFSSTAQQIVTSGDTLSFGVISDNAAFFGVLDALQDRQVAKTLSEPNIMAVSGRPAQFIVGGEVPILIPQSLGTSSIEYKPFGTIVDFLPIVLGNGNIRLEVRPQVSEINEAIGIEMNGIKVPGLSTRRVDTAVEMKAGQTFGLAGLIQEKTISQNRGLPYLSDVPVIGVPFRRTLNDVQEIELLVMITPEFVDPIDGCEAPCGGPGYATTNPTNCQLYCAGHVEVPAHCNPTSGLTACGQDPCANCSSGYCNGCNGCNNGQYMNGGAAPVITDGVTMPGGVGYESVEPSTATDQDEAPADLPLPVQTIPESGAPNAPTPEAAPDGVQYPTTSPTYDAQAPARGGQPTYMAARPHNPPRQPVFLRNPSRPPIQQPAGARPATSSSGNGLIGPIGYDN